MEAQVEELSTILNQLGLPKNVAKTLAYLRYHDDALAVDIEFNAGLRQPEVSVAIQYLLKKNWIKKKNIKKEGKGRPVRIYRLSKPFQDIIKEIEGEKKDSISKMEMLMEKLKKFY
ncbi:MAG: ArsR family transcriptional regulator [Thermoplasmata archaeon]|jgi:predicted transcriptional regulator|nr:ArsR family transcriptional regulator [Thermoplasmata archaeon]MVT13503.1 ArsR family transcriptional regulator [Euryarchaeota archaeon]MVT14560.1 ArsR family transcriptional regulator [Euryarchaeota archaeon]MVT35400.1 ArsR family transcriptional regulator [Euryarchaeota archaeon]